MPPDLVGTFVIIAVLFTIILPGYVIFHRTYYDWVDTLLLCHKSEKIYVRFKKLFFAYMPLASLVSIGIFLAEVGWTSSINLFDLTVFFYSSCLILFLVRALATTPFLKKSRNEPITIIYDVVGAVWIAAIVGSVKLVLLFLWDSQAFSEIVKPLYSPQTLTFSLFELGAWIGTALFPIIIVSSLLEAILFVYCKVAKVDRIWTADDKKEC